MPEIVKLRSVPQKMTFWKAVNREAFNSVVPSSFPINVSKTLALFFIRTFPFFVSLSQKHLGWKLNETSTPPYSPSPPSTLDTQTCIEQEKHYTSPVWGIVGVESLEVVLAISLDWDWECDVSNPLDTETIQVIEAVTYRAEGGGDKPLS